MTIDKEKLKALAQASRSGEWYAFGDLRYEDRKTGDIHGLHHDDDRFIGAANPATILALLAEIERLTPPAGQVSYQEQMEAWKSASSQDLRARGELMIQVEELEAEKEALRKDAERYRWLRCQPNDCSAPRIDICHWTRNGDDSVNEGEGLRESVADEAIDAAMAKEASHG